jgi:hypothetical protein
VIDGALMLPGVGLTAINHLANVETVVEEMGKRAASSAGMATISFDFSSTFTWPSTMRCRAAKAETIWIASFEPLF